MRFGKHGGGVLSRHDPLRLASTDPKQAPLIEPNSGSEASVAFGANYSCVTVASSKALLEKVAEMKGTDRAMATRLHAIITAAAPALSPKTWYGMPAYAKDGKIVCFFQSAEKFDSRYATFGFSDEANIDQGAMWPTSWALKELTAAEEKKIVTLVKKAVR